MPPLIFEEKYANKKNNLAKRKFCSINLDCDLIKQIEIMATHLDKRQNELIEEAIQDLLKKYKDLYRPAEPSSTELFLIKTLTKNT